MTFFTTCIDTCGTFFMDTTLFGWNVSWSNVLADNQLLASLYQTYTPSLQLMVTLQVLMFCQVTLTFHVRWLT